jgi:hypothetical protein
MLFVVLLALAAAIGNDSAVISVINEINTALKHQDEKALAAQFTPDADLWVQGTKMASSREGVLASFKQHQPWSEMLDPQLKNVSVVSIAATKAVVNADEVRVGSAVTRIASLELILVYRKNKWLVDSVRVLSVQAKASSAGGH